MSSKLLEWCRALQAIAQNGLTFSKDPYDIERYQQLSALCVEMLSSTSDVTSTTLTNLFESEKGYATPKVDVRGGVFRDDKILLVRETSDGLWTLPGGWADANEPPSKSIEREIKEESGFEAKCIKLISVFDRNMHGHPPMFFSVYKLFFLCELLGGKATLSHETDKVDFFTEHDLPGLSVARVTEHQIATVFKHHKNHNLPTEFD